LLLKGSVRDDGSIIRNVKELAMAFRLGQVYRCPVEGCGCEVTVTKGAPDDCTATGTPTCCRGHVMQLVEG